jgi:protein-L-isoaspartate(D-aspartate) O-methyltransferase
MNGKPPVSRPLAGDPPRRDRPGFPAKLPTAGQGPAAAVRGAQPGPAQSAFALKSAAIRKPMVATGLGMDSQAVRSAMVQKLQKQGISSPAVLDAMRAVERHRFVDTALATQAYEDTSLPIGLGQTISKPNVVARMLELLTQGHTGKVGRVLEIGTGCGYQAAVLSHLCSEVYSIERLRGLHEKARENLRWFRLSNVHLLFGDGMLGYPRGAPYAGIIAAAGGNDVPLSWTDQLALGGRLVAPAAGPSGEQRLVVIEKTARGLVRTELETVLFVPLKSGVA